MATVDRMAGTLLSAAIGDALGLAAEGMSAQGNPSSGSGGLHEFRAAPAARGFVSDDTEQSAARFQRSRRCRERRCQPLDERRVFGGRPSGLQRLPQGRRDRQQTQRLGDQPQSGKYLTGDRSRPHPRRRDGK